MHFKKEPFYFMLSTASFIIMLLLSYKNTNVLYDQFYSALSLVSGICMLRVSSNNNQIKKQIMTKTETIKLISGTFTPQESRDILRDIFRSKINFHKIKNWSSEERYGEPDFDAQERIDELNADWKELEKIIAEAESCDKNLSISAPIKIQIKYN